jgi:predicted phosphodiesterase
MEVGGLALLGMRIRCINDLHIHGPLETHSLSQLIESIRSSPYPVYLLGDVIDLKNCRKQDVGRAKDAIMELQLLTSYVGGNHCLGYGDLPNYLLINGGTVFLTHGHLYVNAEKYSKWTLEHKEAGAGFFKRHLITPLIDKLRRFKEVKPNSELAENVRILKIQYPKLTHFIMGHTHSPETVTTLIHGVTVILLKRGINDVELP